MSGRQRQRVLAALVLGALLLTGCGAALTVPASTPVPSRTLATPAPAATASPETAECCRITQETFPVQRGAQMVEVPATVTLPAEGYGWPVVVLCHGFTGDREGDGHFPRLARSLARAGIASIALDFAGNGESTEPFTHYTLTEMQDDIHAAIQFMFDRYGANPSVLGLVGHSMGGRAVSLCLGDEVTAAALWSPANNPGLDGAEFLAHTSEERQALLNQARRTGSVELPQWGVTVSNEFLEQMAESDPCAALEQYRGALLVSFAGADPDLLSQQTIDRTEAAAEARGLPWVDLYGQFEDATHNYTALEGGDEDAIAARLEDATVEFLCQALLAES